MAEQADSVQGKNDKAPDREKAENDALITRMAKENLLGPKDQNLMSFDKAPDNKLTRYATAAGQGITRVPQGIWNSVVHNVSNPLDAATTFGMGAGMAVVLKTVLPEGGMAGKLAAGAIGLYFTVKAAEPIFDGFKQAGSAVSMSQLDAASTQIGNAGGAFIVDTGIAVAGYRIGSHYTGRALSSQPMDGFADAKASFYEGLGNNSKKLANAVGIRRFGSPESVANTGLEPRVNFLPSERTAPQGILKGQVDANASMEVSVMLKSKASDLKMQRTLERIAQGRQQPLSDAQIAEKFGATQESLNAVTKFAAENGLTVSEANLMSGRVVLRGSTGQFTEAFQTKLAQYEANTGQLFRGREGSLSVPRELTKHIVGILGMDDRPQAKSYIVKFAGPAELPTAPPDGPVGPAQPQPNASRRGFLPNEVADAYNFPKDLTGKGQAVGIIQLGGGFDPVDNAAYYKQHKLPQPKVKIIETNGGKNSPGQAADSEVMLDSQVIGTVAPGAQQHIIFAPNTEKGFADAVLRATFPEKGEMQNSAISISWGLGEEGWSRQAITGMNQAFKKAALKGISIFAAAGDDGARNNSSSGKFQTDYPASDPHVTGAGGTRLVTDGAGKRQSEVVWNNNRRNDAGGGGISEVFGPQEFQKVVTIPPNANNGTLGRGVPDVAGNADPVTGYRIRVAGSETITGGTSAVSPLYSGLMMRINEGIGRPFGTPLNEWLYKNHNSNIFNDIIVGDNGGYKATTGWDAATGLGSLDGTRLLNLIKSKPFLDARFGEYRWVGPTTVGPAQIGDSKGPGK